MKFPTRLTIAAALLALPVSALAKDDATTQPAVQQVQVQIQGWKPAGNNIGWVENGGGNASAAPFQANIEFGKPEKAAYLGVSVAAAGAALSSQLKLPPNTGLLVSYVDPQGPAKTGGIEANDVLSKLDDQVLVDPHQLTVLVRDHKAGDEVKLTVIHQAQSKEVSVKLVEKEVFAEGEEGHEPMMQMWDNGQGPHAIGSFPAMAAASGWGKPGVRELEVSRDGRRAHLHEDDKGLTMTITENGATKEYKAANPEELRKHDPQAHEIYEDFFGQAEATPFFLNGNGNQMRVIVRMPEAAAVELPDGVNIEAMTCSNGMTLTLSRDGDTGLHLLAKDPHETTLFDGPVSTEEQRKSIPKEVREKLQKMLDGPPRPMAMPMPPPMLPPQE